MDKITLMRGNRKVTFEKLPETFAVRLRSGRASDERTLAAAAGRPYPGLTHLATTGAENLEVFNIDQPSELEEVMGELRMSPASEVVTHVFRLDNGPGGTVIPTGAMTIQFRPDIDDDRRAEILGEFGLQVVEELDYLPHAYTVQLTSASRENPLKIAARLQARPEITVAEPDLAFERSLKYVPDEPLYREQWHLSNRGDGVGLAAGADVKAEQAWDISRGTRDVVVCVIDDGFDLGHPDFVGQGKIVTPRDFGQDDTIPDPVLTGDNHGTACAGVAIAEENGSGTIGLAPRCAFMPVRMGPWLSDEAVVAMFRHAMDNHADVVSCSWSAQAWDFPLSTKISAIIHTAATRGRRNGKGCVILFAAGNENRPLDGEKDGQRSYQGFALHPDVIAVAASNSLDRRSNYSNFGPQLALCAPTSGAPGRGIVTTDRRGAAGYSTEDYTRDFGGTSSATPLAAGLAALILSVAPELSAADVKRIMMETADKIDPDNGQYDDGGHSPWYGHGRINAAAALQMASGAGNAPRLPQTLYIEHRVNKPILDLADIEDGISFPETVQAQGIEVSVDIRHSYRGDLRVRLVAPTGHEVILHDREGGGRQDLVASYRSSSEPALFEPLISAPAQGRWHLRIADMASGDEGMLVKWGLAISY